MQGDERPGPPPFDVLRTAALSLSKVPPQPEAKRTTSAVASKEEKRASPAGGERSATADIPRMVSGFPKIAPELRGHDGCALTRPFRGRSAPGPRDAG